MTAEATGARPPSLQAEAQRERILDAAQKCFIERGFHAASIASIAETAGMSAGLMYRYFENKNTIVKAIIERELERNDAKIAELYTRADLLARIVDTFRQWQLGDPEAMNAALYLEVAAEATRDAEIAGVVAESDAWVRGEFQRWLGRSRAEGGLGLSPEAARARALLMQCLVGGLVVRAVREPDLDPDALRHALEPLLRYLGLTPPDDTGASAGRGDDPRQRGRTEA